MAKNVVKILNLWLLIWVTFAVPACGKIVSGPEPLSVSVKIPDGEAPDLFWFGVEKKTLQVKSTEDSKDYPWEEGKALELDLKAGDYLTFQGFDADSRLLVTGEVTVGESKTVSVPLRRVLY